MKTIKVNIVTPDGPVVETEADMIISTTEAGEIGVLPGHVAMVAPLQIGALRIKKGGTIEAVAVHGGFMEVRPEVVTILAQSAEAADSIDIARAKTAQKRASARVKAEQDAREAKAAELELKRAINRINVYEGNY